MGRRQRSPRCASPLLGGPMHSTARHAATALFLLCLAASTWPGTPAPRQALEAGAQWIGVERDGVLTLQHGVDSALLRDVQDCPPDDPIRPGDRIVLTDDCATTIAPLSARQRLALGVRLDINTASLTELQAVSGIGPALARRIVARRPYATLADLERVRGIGPVRRGRLTSSLTPAPLPPLWPSSTPLDASTLQKP